jgi:hypothetical protein
VGPWWTNLDTLRGSILERPFWIRRLRKKEVRATAVVGGAAELHGGEVTGVSPEWHFVGRGLTTRGLGGGGDDGEAIFGISEEPGGRGRAHDNEERAATLGASGEEWGEGEELW